jgi:hypothetical protein
MLDEGQLDGVRGAGLKVPDSVSEILPLALALELVCLPGRGVGTADRLRGEGARVSDVRAVVLLQLYYDLGSGRGAGRQQ